MQNKGDSATESAKTLTYFKEVEVESAHAGTFVKKYYQAILEAIHTLPDVYAQSEGDSGEVGVELSLISIYFYIKTLLRGENNVLYAQNDKYSS